MWTVDVVILKLENVAIIARHNSFVVTKGPQDYVVLTPDRLKEELEKLVDRIKAENESDRSHHFPAS